MVNCFACGKDIGVSTERRSFSDERPSESKVRVLHAWRSMVQEELSLSGHRSLVPRPTSQLRMDYITATRVGLVSSCTNFCPVAPECCRDQSDLRYALIAYSSY